MKKKTLLMSILTIVMCLSLSVGATFALFTSEDSVNIVATSGKVTIAATIDQNSVQTKQLYDTDYTDGASSMYEGVATFGNEGLTLTNLVPGDAIKFNIVVSNTSDVTVKYRTVISSSNDTGLFAGLIVNIDDRDNYNGVRYVTNWAELAVGSANIVIPVEIELPEGAGNEYQEKSCTVTYFVEAVQGNAKTTNESQSVIVPAEPNESVTLKASGNSKLEVELPKETLEVLTSKSVALSHSEPKVENNVITFETMEIVDENGNVIDLEAKNNTQPINVKLSVGDTFNEGETVVIYHDGIIVATAIVDAEKCITYAVTHFCKVEVGYNDGKIDEFVELETAVANAKDGETIVIGGNISNKDGILIEDKNIVIDLNGYEFTVSEGASTNSRAFKIIGSSIVTVKNGTVVADATKESGAYGTFRTEGTAELTLENLKLYNYRGGGLNIKANEGTNVTINNCEIYSQYGGGVEAASGSIVLNNTKIEQEGVYGNGWYSVAMEINGGGKITVNSGEYFGSAIATDDNAVNGNSIAFILSSGGTLDIYGGTFTGIVAENADNHSKFCGLIYADNSAVVNIYGGTFNSNGAILDMRSNSGNLPAPKATIYGGTFSADPSVSGLYGSNLITIANGNSVVQSGDYYLVGKPVATVDELKNAIKNAVDGDVILLVNDITVTDNWDERYGGRTSKNVTINGLGNTLKFTNTVKDNNYSCVLRFEGVAQVENLTFDLSEVAGNGSQLRAISAKSSLTVDNCTFIGSTNYTNTRAIIFGEGNGTVDASVVVTNSTFINWRRGVTDNENAKDFKSVLISGNKFEKAALYVSAYESVTISDNEFVSCCVNVTSYTNAANVKVVVLDNILDADSYNVVGSASKVFTATNVTAQEGIIVNAK